MLQRFVGKLVESKKCKKKPHQNIASLCNFMTLDIQANTETEVR